MCRSLMRIFFIPHCFIRARTNPPQQASLQCCIVISKNKQQTKLNDSLYIHTNLHIFLYAAAKLAYVYLDLIAVEIGLFTNKVSSVLSNKLEKI